MIEAVDLLSKGLSNQEIAQAMGITSITVKQYLKAAYAVLRVNGRVELALNWNCELYQIGLREMGYL